VVSLPRKAAWSITWTAARGIAAKDAATAITARSHAAVTRIAAVAVVPAVLRPFPHVAEHAVQALRGRATASIAKRLQESLCYGRVARRAPMTVGKKMNRIGG
jgi:hypothetical protein